MPYEDLIAKRAAQKRYSMTAKGKETRHRYYLSLKAKHKETKTPWRKKNPADVIQRTTFSFVPTSPRSLTRPALGTRALMTGVPRGPRSAMQPGR